MENFRDHEILKPYTTEGKDGTSNDFFYGEGELSVEMEIEFPFTSKAVDANKATSCSWSFNSSREKMLMSSLEF